LAGSLVANILRRTARFVIDEKAKGRNVKVLAIGKKGATFLNRSGQDLSGRGNQAG
jgi:F0F1-type ATP synthase gamma subunit